MAVLRIWKVMDVSSALRQWKSISDTEATAATTTASSANDYWFVHPDNESQVATTTSCWNHRPEDARYHLPYCSCCSTPHTPQQSTLLYKILYWCKMIVVKVGRSYYALPVLLILATLLFGILIGYCIGRQQQLVVGAKRSQYLQRRQSAMSYTYSDVWNTTIFIGVLQSMCSYFMEMIHFRYIFYFFVGRQPSYSYFPSNGTYNVPLRRTDSNQGDIEVKEQIARVQLKSENETQCESGLLPSELPRHIAVVMDGNRRYGIQMYNNAIQGHWDGSQKLLQFTKWCLAERIPEITVYAFSTENWSRDTVEISSLMNIIILHCEELRIEARKKRISIHIHSTDPKAMPNHVREALYQLEKETYDDNPSLKMNICLSYGSRGEIVNACRSVVDDYLAGRIQSSTEVNEETLSRRMLISGTPPDLFLRTSGEMRLSNFLLWQMAYTELFFLDKKWPELQKDDFLNVLRCYARGRKRRFGK
jgi:undecaprenyl diphosphate synthase